MLSHMRIRTRLLAGFIVILTLLGVVAGASYVVFGTTAQGFTRFAGSAHLAVVSVDFDRQVQAFDRTVTDYLRAPSDDTFLALQERRAALEESMASLHEEAAGTPIADNVETIAQAFDTYKAALDPAMALVAKRVDLITRTLEPTAKELVVSARLVQERAEGEGDAGMVATTARLVQHMLQAQRALDDYMLTRSEDSFARVWEELFLVDEAIAWLPETSDAHTHYQTYQDALNELSGLIGEIWALEDTLAEQGALIARESQAAKERALAEETRIQTAAEGQLGDAQVIVVVLAAVSLVVGFAAAFGIGRSIVHPIGAMTGAMRRLADGDLEVAIPAVGRRDEIGEMASAVQVFKDNAIEVKRLEEERRATEAEARRQRRQAILSLADELEQSVAGAVNAISSSANDVQAAAETMSATAQGTSEQATTVASTTQEANTSVEIAAAATEELSASIREISSQVAQSAQIAQQAVEQAQDANAQVASLLEATNRIGEVVQLITDIAEQTNLLALNATIEAARAGDAGKGFAVVANEVKNLANQTAKATDEISQQIGSVQDATNRAVDTIRAITDVIDRMNEISSAISAAVEEQGAATEEIARNAQQAAEGTVQVTRTIDGVRSAADETGSAARKVLTEANALLAQAGDLRSVVDRFLHHIREDDAA